jgi:hypothetical protein
MLLNTLSGLRLLKLKNVIYWTFITSNYPSSRSSTYRAGKMAYACSMCSTSAIHLFYLLALWRQCYKRRKIFNTLNRVTRFTYTIIKQNELTVTVSVHSTVSKAPVLNVYIQHEDKTSRILVQSIRYEVSGIRLWDLYF